MPDIFDKNAYSQGYHAALNGFSVDFSVPTNKICDSYLLGFHDGKMKRRHKNV